MSHTLLISDPRFLDHDPGPGHPESQARLTAIVRALRADPVAEVTWATARPATDDELTAVHTPRHVAQLAAYDGRAARLDADTVLSAESWRVARLAAGAAAQAVASVWSGEAANAFVLCRPPGHHASAERAMGFCVLNNAAVAAAAALRLGANRVAILDWDVHHGNGTQQLFEARQDVLYLSAHQFPFYPGTGAADEIGDGEGAGFTINCALPPHQGDADYGAVFREIFLPALHRFAADVVIVSAGFDAHERDPLGEMRVTERGFAAMCGDVLDAASKVVLVLEGGYDLQALADSVHACVAVLGGRRDSFPQGAGPRASEAIAATRRAHERSGRSLIP